MDQGRATEFDHPFKLLTNDDADTEITKTNEDGTDGHFAKMLKAGGSESSQVLFDIAK